MNVLLEHLQISGVASPDPSDIIDVESYYDDTTFALSFVFLDHLGAPTSPPADVIWSSRLYNVGDTITQLCEGTTLHKFIAAQLNLAGSQPRFNKDEQQLNSPSCGGPTDVFIERFVIEDPANPANRTEIRVYYDSVTFVPKARAWKIENDGSLTNEQTPPATLSGITTDRSNLTGSVVWAVCDGNDLHEYKAQLEYPYVNDVVTANSPTCVNNNPSCDLQVLSVTPVMESAIGAADGEIIINAVSTNGPINYSINGGAAQLDNVFDNLTSGVYSISITDALGCFQSRQIELVVQRSIIQSTPERQVSVGNLSRWSALFNPVVFLFQRKDYVVTGITADNTQQVSVTIATELTAAEIELAIASQVYVKSDNYEFLLQPTQITTPGGNTSVLVFNSLNIGLGGNDASEGYINALGLKRGHRFATEISYGYSTLRTVTARHSANGKGQARADIATYLKPLLKPVDTFTHNVVNFRDENLGASYIVRYREEWDDGAGDWIYITDPFYVTYSARQIGDALGGNMGKYVTFDNGVDRALFMNEYKMPTYHLTLPFDLTFIYSEHIAGLQIKVMEIPLDINLQPIVGGVSDSFLLNEDGSFLLQEDGSKFIIARANIAGALGLVEHVGVNRLKLSGLYPDNAKYIDVYLYYMDGDDQVVITEMKRVKLSNKPSCDYRLLKFIGPLGGWNYALFEYRTERKIDVSQTQTIDRFVEDYEIDEGNVDVIGKAASKKEIVGKDGVDQQEFEALETMLYSPKVYVLTNENPVQWRRVIVETKAADLNARYNLSDIEIVYRLPDINTQKQ